MFNATMLIVEVAHADSLAVGNWPSRIHIFVFRDSVLKVFSIPARVRRVETFRFETEIDTFRNQNQTETKIRSKSKKQTTNSR